VKPPAWAFWAPVAVICLGLYRLATGDVLLSLLSLSMGTLFLGAGLLAHRHRS
jgi:hypothetical protein